MQLPINSNLIIVPLNQLFNAGPTLMDQCMIIFPERTQVCRVSVTPLTTKGSVAGNRKSSHLPVVGNTK